MIDSNVFGESVQKLITNGVDVFPIDIGFELSIFEASKDKVSIWWYEQRDEDTHVSNIIGIYSVFNGIKIKPLTIEEMMGLFGL